MLTLSSQPRSAVLLTCNLSTTDASATAALLIQINGGRRAMDHPVTELASAPSCAPRMIQITSAELIWIKAWRPCAGAMSGWGGTPMHAQLEALRWVEENRLQNATRLARARPPREKQFAGLCPPCIREPSGFTLTEAVYRNALAEAGLWAAVHALLHVVDVSDAGLLAERAELAQSLVYEATGTRRLQHWIQASYADLEWDHGRRVAVAVHGNAASEEVPSASFAGHHDGFLNVRSGEAVYDACRRCFASIFSERAITYRARHGISHDKVAFSVSVSAMVRPGAAAAFASAG